MVTQQQMVCDRCRGEGEMVPEDKKCPTCKGKKLTEGEKILKVEIDKGAHDGIRS